jgi:hypothetical protein
MWLVFGILTSLAIASGDEFEFEPPPPPRVVLPWDDVYEDLLADSGRWEPRSTALARDLRELRRLADDPEGALHARHAALIALGDAEAALEIERRVAIEARLARKDPESCTIGAWNGFVDARIARYAAAHALWSSSPDDPTLLETLTLLDAPRRGEWARQLAAHEDDPRAVRAALWLGDAALSLRAYDDASAWYATAERLGHELDEPDLAEAARQHGAHVTRERANPTP